MKLLAANADSAFGRRHGFAKIASVADYQRQVPIIDYDDLTAEIAAIRGGRPGILTSEPVRMLEPSSGSSATSKLIPWTSGLKREFQAGIGPWIADIFARWPACLNGRAYWAVSPPMQLEVESAVPVGFEQDADYLSGFEARLAKRVMAVPGSVRELRNLEHWRTATLQHLLAAADLRLISVWNPSFLSLLLAHAEGHEEELLAGLPSPRRRVVERAFAKAASERWQALWPRLRLVSCWMDAWAARPAAELQALLPWVDLQPKGLLATEAFVSLPFGARHVLAVNSHFFEFEELDTGALRLAHELMVDGEYGVVVSTAGGLYRYRLHDRVRVVGHHSTAPCLQFLGKTEAVSDLVGEKLHEGHVKRVLEPLTDGFWFLAPAADLSRYVLYADAVVDVTALERGLAANVHYRYARDLGQLKAVRGLRVENLQTRYLGLKGRGTGSTVKPRVLEEARNWAEELAR